MGLRVSGILLHPSCLPSQFGIGDLGPQAHRFVALLAEARQHCWQMLPLNPTEAAHGHSPYHSISAFAGNPLLISPALLLEDGWLTRSDLAHPPCFPEDRVDFAAVGRYKTRLLRRAHERLCVGTMEDAFARFCQETPWLDDYALFKALKRHFGKRSWTRWPVALRDRNPEALREAAAKFGRDTALEKCLQFLFFGQWRRLKALCREKAIELIGDVPLYVPLESADVWCHPSLFMLGEDLRPLYVSGVPPDYFSRTGQLWGHPVYRWQMMKSDGFRWWTDRLTHALSLFDGLRLDHFRGFVAYWQVPARAKTAAGGRWQPAPAEDFLRHVYLRLPGMPFIAEDLGIITAEVREIMQRFGLPGMRLLLFAFGEDFPDSAFLPHHYIPHCVAYTGTHDNNTIHGWFQEESGSVQRRNLFAYLGRQVSPPQLHWELIRLVEMSVANTAIIPLQDLLGLNAAARMNRPARARGNWRWRFPAGALSPPIVQRLRDMTLACGRA